MTWAQVLSYCVTFLVGGLTGATGTYLGNKYTDQRKKQEARSEADTQFRDIQKAMPELIQRMKEDFCEGQMIREFVMLRHSRDLNYTLRREHFRYFGDEHKNLREKLILLQQGGYIQDVSTTTLPIFRATEEFVKKLRKNEG
jgi:hypothetical protein